MEFTLLDRDKADIFQDYLPAEVYERRGDGTVFFLGASTEEEIVGVAAFQVGTEAELLSVAVSPAWQRKDIGSGLVEEAADRLKAAGAESLAAIVEGTAEEAEGLGKFLWRCGMDPEESVQAASFPLSVAMENETLRYMASRPASPKVVPLTRVSDVEKRRFGRFLAQSDLFYGWNWEHMLPNASAAYIEQGKIEGCVLFSHQEGELGLEYAYVGGGCTDKTTLLQMLVFCMEKLRTFGEETMVNLVAMNEVSLGIMERLVGDGLERSQIRRYVMKL